MTSDSSDDLAPVPDIEGTEPLPQSEETLLESSGTQQSMAWVAFCHELNELLDTKVTSIIDIAQATTLTEIPTSGSFGTVRELLAAESPSLQILTMLKSAAKHRSKDADGELNAPTAIYLTAICAARLRLNAKITEFADKSLVDRIDRMLNEGELPSPIAELLVDTRFKLVMGNS